MYINPNSVSATGIDINGQISADKNLPPLSEGDTIAARVIFSGEGSAHLKTADGALIRARLEGGVILPEGSEVLLTVEEKNADSLTLRIAEVRGGAPHTARPALPPALAAVFEQIQASGLPAAQKTEMFTKALTDFPALSLRNAAVQEALAALSAPGNAQTSAVPGQNNIGQMLAELAALLSSLERPAPGGQQTATGANFATGKAASTVTVNANPLPGAATTPAANPATGNVAGSAATANPMVETAAANAAPTTATTMQATATVAGATANVAAEIAAPATANLASGGAVPIAAPTVNPMLETAAHNTNINAATGATSPNTGVTINPATGTSIPAAANQAQASPAPAATVNHAPPMSTTAEAAAQTVDANTEMTQHATMQQREALQTARQIAGELYTPGQGEPGSKALGQFIERLFARVGHSVEQGGTELQRCSRELDMRLNLLKEAISHSSLPQREELLSQTNRILQQTEALRESRLLCLQLPIQFEQQRQTAELYVYRRERRGKPKLDPQNATILLALNTEHLGRLEALIQTRGKEINLKLEISRADAVLFVREHSQALAGLLKEAGFKLNSSSIEQLKRETTSPMDAERALREYQRDFDGKFDFFI